MRKFSGFCKFFLIYRKQEANFENFKENYEKIFKKFYINYIKFWKKSGEKFSYFRDLKKNYTKYRLNFVHNLWNNLRWKLAKIVRIRNKNWKCDTCQEVWGSYRKFEKNFIILSLKYTQNWYSRKTMKRNFKKISDFF